MFVSRRTFVGSAAFALLGACAGVDRSKGPVEENFGLIGEIKALPGKGGQLAALLLDGSRDMPGNIAYIVAQSNDDPDSIWVTEVWNTKTEHGQSLKLPQVQAAIAKARPLIAGFGFRVETRPLMVF